MSLMLAHTYSQKRDVTNWLWSEKLDGVRAELRNGKLYSRNNKPIHAPKWWLEMFPLETNLDGELYVGRGMFQQTISYVRKKVPIDVEWEKVQYLVFDCLDNESLPFTERIKSYPRSLYHALITNLDKHFQDTLALGGEGVMLRNPTSPYERKRSWNLLKLKPELKTQAKVVGYIDGLGKHEGRVGALKCVLDNGIEFCVGTGLTDIQRESPPRKGEIVMIGYQELTQDGVPRFPVYL